MTDHEHDNGARFTDEQYTSLVRRVEAGQSSDETVYACSVEPADHVHMRRMGAKGDGDEGRVGIMIHDSDGENASAYFSASEARIIAADMLTFADELDGVVPLQFFEPQVIPQESLDVPEVSDEDTIVFTPGFNLAHATDEDDDEDDYYPPLDDEDSDNWSEETVEGFNTLKDGSIPFGFGTLKPHNGGWLVYKSGDPQPIAETETLNDGLTILRHVVFGDEG